jgi:hypothetical protein
MQEKHVSSIPDTAQDEALHDLLLLTKSGATPFFLVLTDVTRLLLLLLLLLPLLLAITQYYSGQRLQDAYLPLLLASAAVTPLAETPALVAALHHTHYCIATCF